MENLSRLFQKQKEKTHEETEFHNSIQDLLPFTSCRKELTEMPDFQQKQHIKVQISRLLTDRMKIKQIYYPIFQAICGLENDMRN